MVQNVRCFKISYLTKVEHNGIQAWKVWTCWVSKFLYFTKFWIFLLHVVGLMNFETSAPHYLLFSTRKMYRCSEDWDVTGDIWIA